MWQPLWKLSLWAEIRWFLFLHVNKYKQLFWCAFIFSESNSQAKILLPFQRHFRKCYWAHQNELKQAILFRTAHTSLHHTKELCTAPPVHAGIYLVSVALWYNIQKLACASAIRHSLGYTNMDVCYHSGVQMWELSHKWDSRITVSSVPVINLPFFL